MDNQKEFWPVRDGDALTAQIAAHAKHYVPDNRFTVLSAIFVNALQDVYGFKESQELKLMCYAVGTEMARIASEESVRLLNRKPHGQHDSIGRDDPGPNVSFDPL